MKKGVLFSIVLHSLFLYFFVFLSINKDPQNPNSSAPQNNTIQVRTLSQKEFSQASKLPPPKTQIVQNDKHLKASETPPENARFLSHQNLNVDNQTRAQRIGEFKNVQKNGQQKQTPQTSDFFKLTRNPKDLEQEQSLSSKTGRLRAPASTQDNQPIGEGYSQTDDYLQDIAVSSQTLLNTREFVFFSFYDRIRKTLRQTWNQRLESEISKLLQSGNSLPYQINTSVRVQLNTKGELINVNITQRSGVDALDQAARMAFYDAAPFPNPPKGLVLQTNEIEINWDFIIVSEPQGPVRFDVKRSY